MLRKTLSVAALMIAAACLFALAMLPSAWADDLPAGPTRDSAQNDLTSLVQQLIDARINYSENLHRLVEFYEKTGNTQRRDCAKRELKEFRDIRQRDYLPNLKPRILPMDLANFGESDIVEALVQCRQTYRQKLASLAEILGSAKDDSRYSHAKRELEGLISVNKYLYLRDADTPKLDLEPRWQIDQADKLYAQLLKLKKESKPLWVNRYKTQSALEGFRDLIRDYHSSDKIDEAAYQIAEICRNNLEDYQRAVRWYECVLAWDPQTKLPVNYNIAKIYDQRLLNRLTALNYYRLALDEFARGSSQRRDIQRRIDQLRENRPH